jgi:hypothetical protein
LDFEKGSAIMPTAEEISLSQAEARVKELEEQVANLKDTNLKLSKRLDTDKVLQEHGRLNRELGRLQAELETAQERVGKLQAKCETQAEEKSGLSAALAEKIREIHGTEEKFKEAMKALHASQVAMAARGWAPWISAALVAGLVFFFVARGIIIPRTGNLTADVNNSLNQLNMLEQERRTREIDLQKPHQAWGLNKIMTVDENAVLIVNVYTNDEKKYSKTQTEFVSSLILAACRNRLSVIKLNRDFLAAVAEQGIPQVAIQDADQVAAFLNQELKESGLGAIRDKIPEFNFCIQAQFLKASSEQERLWGCGLLFFKNGKFSGHQDQPIRPIEPGA